MGGGLGGCSKCGECFLAGDREGDTGIEREARDNVCEEEEIGSEITEGISVAVAEVTGRERGGEIGAETDTDRDTGACSLAVVDASVPTVCVAVSACICAAAGVSNCVCVVVCVCVCVCAV